MLSGEAKGRSSAPLHWLRMGWGEGDDLGLGQSVEGADDVAALAGDAVGVNHGGLDAIVTKPFLDAADVGSLGEEMGGEGMAQGVGGDSLGDACFAGGCFEGFAEGVFVDVVAAHNAGGGIGAFAFGGPKPEPRPFLACVGELAFEAVG